MKELNDISLGTWARSFRVQAFVSQPRQRLLCHRGTAEDKGVSYKQSLQVSTDTIRSTDITQASEDLNIFHLPVHSFHGAPGFLFLGVRKESEASRSLRYPIHHETNWSNKHEVNLNNSEAKTSHHIIISDCHLP